MRSVPIRLPAWPLLLLLLPRPALATWALVAVDPDSGEVGAAGATCGPMVWMIGQVEPEVGAVVSLCATSFSGRRSIARDLVDGATPDEALDPVVDPEGDKNLDVRQYAVAAFSGPSAAFSGDGCDDWRGAHVAETFAVAGNTLGSEDVLDEAVVAFEGSAGEPLAERLLLGLEAGADQGGDSRCAPEVAAESAFLSVAAPGDGHRPGIDLTASDKDGAVAALREKWEDGRQRSCHLQCSSASGPAPVLPLILSLAIAALRRRGHGRRPDAPPAR